MKFKCGHDELSGKDGVCFKCYEKGLRASDFKTRKKIGRPVTKTPAQRRKKREQWFKDHAEERRKYHREYARKKRTGTTIFRPCFVIDGKMYRGERCWTPDIRSAKVFQSEGRARASVIKTGRGEVVEATE